MFRKFAAIGIACALWATAAYADNEAPVDSKPTQYYPIGGGGLQVGNEEFLKNYSSLAGLEGVYVLLDYVFGSSESNGIKLRHDDLEEQVRKRLEEAGLKFLTKEDMEHTPGQPEMAVYPAYSGGSIGLTGEALAELNAPGSCGFSCCRNSIWVGFSQSATLLRRPNSHYKLGTWGAGDDSNWCENRGDWMYDAVLGVIDQFVEDYKQAESENEPVSITTAEEVPANCAQTWSLHLQIFDTDSAEIKEDILPIMNKFVKQAKRCVNYKYLIETHADSRASEQYNQLLTQVRAASMKEFLLSAGLEYNRITTASFGESQPISDGTTAEDHALNRRVVIRPEIRQDLISAIDP